MEKLSFKTITMLVLCCAALASGAEAQTADVAGPWTLRVTTDQSTTTPSLTLVQDGATLSGHYSSETLGEQEVTGSVDGMTVMISFTADMQGQSITVDYRGTLGEDGVITGSLDIASGALQGTFTARRADG